jgi:hypothetical protein
LQVSTLYKWLWKSCVRGKHKFFYWLLLKDWLNTRNLLRRKTMVLPNYNCVLCVSGSEETLVHLFFSCSFSQWCWRFVGINWDLSLMTSDMIIAGRRLFHSRIFREMSTVAC